jgi:23S rRNA pseudouridine1911/1915/1917 synthase
LRGGPDTIADQTPDPVDDEEIEGDLDLGATVLEVVLGPDQAGVRLDKALTALPLELSRARLQALIAAGAVDFEGEAVRTVSSKAQAGVYTLRVPAPTEATPQPENLPLEVLFEDAHLIVVVKPAGMASHPGPGCWRGTLVNALLHRCAGTLSGIGGVIRPGIVHRLDKDTSGVLVAAKTDAAHAGLSDLFARHDIDREYVAFTRGGPTPAQGLIEGRIGRSPWDRKKMALLKTGGREAVTRYRVEQAYGAPTSAGQLLAARVRCRLETGRTHQIRVHLASRGAPCLGDAVYGSSPPTRAVREALVEAGLQRQALHAAVLGFIHPVTGEALRFETPLPPDLSALERALQALA